MWLLGFELRTFGRAVGCSNPLSHLTSPQKTGMNKLYLSVERKNEPSVKTIIRNGGVYERSFEMDGEQADIYRIALPE